MLGNKIFMAIPFVPFYHMGNYFAFAGLYCKRMSNQCKNYRKPSVENVCCSPNIHSSKQRIPEGMKKSAHVASLVHERISFIDPCSIALTVAGSFHRKQF